jgi:two-component system cell cycle sensor histidine kinase PleC
VLLVETVAGLLGDVANAKDIELIGFCAPDVPSALRGDPVRLRQVLVNLVSNAVKFTPDGGGIVVRGECRDDCAIISIMDSGIGIAKDALAKLGRPFEQVENQHTRSHQGSGLGLAIAKSLVELHGGSMRIRSSLGRGTMVQVRMPVEPNCRLPKHEAA